MATRKVLIAVHEVESWSTELLVLVLTLLLRHCDSYTLMWGHAKPFIEIFHEPGNIFFALYSIQRALVQTNMRKLPPEPPPGCSKQKRVGILMPTLLPCPDAGRQEAAGRRVNLLHIRPTPSVNRLSVEVT